MRERSVWQGPGQTQESAQFPFEDTKAKAQICVEIARHILGNPKDDGGVENQAFALMSKSVQELEVMRQELGSVAVEGAAVETIHFEELSPAAVKGLDNFRAWMREARIPVTYDHVNRRYCLLQEGEPRVNANLIGMFGLMMGVVLASEPDYAKAKKAAMFALFNHNMWIRAEKNPDYNPDMDPPQKTYRNRFTG